MAARNCRLESRSSSSPEIDNGTLAFEMVAIRYVVLAIPQRVSEHQTKFLPVKSLRLTIGRDPGQATTDVSYSPR